MFKKFFSFFGKDLNEQEIDKFSLLALAFFFTVGSYWLLKTLKDGFFFNSVGGDYQPKAKMLSLIAISILVPIYSKLVDYFHRHQLFYIIGSFYATFFGLVSILLLFPFDTPGTFYHSFIKIVAWATYILIESFGSIMVALFWSFVASTTDASSAKRGYFLIVAGAQLGAIVGPFLAWNAQTLGLPLLFFIATLCIVALMLVIKHFKKTMPQDLLIGSKYDKRPEEKTGFMEGLKLILTRSYLFGLFLLVAFFEVVTTIVDYQMKMQAHSLPQYATKEGLTSFMGMFGMSTNLLAFIMALFGTGFLIKKFGVRISLLIFPVSIGIAISILYTFIKLDFLSAQNMLWVTFGVVIVAKGLSYALNNPAKEVTYIPTSRDAKFKSKGWIDMFGARGAKALGSGFNEFLKRTPQVLLYTGTILSLGLIGIWIMVAYFVGNKFHRLVKEGKIVK
jgi:ATP:ADP antiporter, AAA family